MAHRRHNFRRGFTLIEVMITIIAAIILLIGITGILAAGHKNFKTMFRRTSQGVVPDAYAARRAFELIVRKSSIKRLDPSTVYSNPSNQIYVYYYSDPSFIVEGSIPDKYAHFYLSNRQFILDTGSVTGNFGAIPPNLPSLAQESRLILANNINSVAFTESNHSIQMVLMLDNETGSSDPLGTLRMTLIATAIQHN
jgi:competence protein ComGC